MSSLSPGETLSFGGVTFVPILGKKDMEGPDASLLEEAMAHGHTELTEVSAEGKVNALRIRHRGDQRLLLLDGEEVLGAKQNRIFNTSFLIPPDSVVEVPVSCVEQGRWSYDSCQFLAAQRVVSSHTRSRKLRSLTGSLRQRGHYDTDQRAVWEEVRKYGTRVGGHAPTGAFSALADSRVEHAEALLPRLTPLPEQVGLALVHGSSLVSLDIFGSPSLFTRAWKKLARGMLLEVYGDAPQEGDAWGIVARALLSLPEVATSRRPAPGCGETLHGIDRGMAVSALTYEGHVYHLVATAA